MLTASRSTNGRAKPTGHGQPNGDGAYGHDSNDAGPRPGGEERESLLTEQRGLGNNLRGRRVGSAWPGRLPDATLYMQRFNVCELFGRDSRFPQIVGFRKFPKKFPPPRQGRFGSFFRWLPLLPELVMSIPVLEISGHRIPYGHRVVARAVLGGLHHEYRLEEITA